MTDDKAYTSIGRAPNKVESADKPEKTGENLDDSKIHEAKEKSRDGLTDKLATPGALEVEDMPESNELQERRRSTHDLLSEQVTDEELDAAFSDDGGIMGMLEDANLSPRHLRFCFGGVLVLALIAALIFGGWYGVSKVDWGGLFERSESDREEVVEVEEEVEDQEDVESEEEAADNGFESEEFAAQYGFLDGTVFSGILIGEEVAEDDGATSAGEDLGLELVTDDSLAVLISDFSEMYEALQVDVQALLDQSRDRQETLDDYTHELNYLLYVGRNNLEQLQEDNDYLVEQYSEAEGEKDIYEERFFEKMQVLDSYGSVAALNDFIAEAEYVVNLRAQYQAREKLITYYDEVITALEARVTDIQLNEEALVKGVQVVDIIGSDIDLILEESDL